ncbi:MAG: AmmeMemoRadiSam system radical SAM enzyme [Candidatus Dadabacteria bacterium]|nr:MAG: AmmeMemoRadiSam system radical SAM enzyme [Candidatus Dadabacteria bacterium]
MAAETFMSRRLFVRRALIGTGAAILGLHALDEFYLHPGRTGFSIGFRNDAPEHLWRFSREALWYERRGELVRCILCPHECILGDNDRGFCRTRVVKEGSLYTIAYGNPCAVHVDPIEKKPLFHYLPTAPILSIATAGCNLRCLNCQNWQISQARPEDTRNADLMPERLVETAERHRIPAIAYTYSEPLVAYEYVRDSAQLARSHGIRNVLVTAGYINENPLRELLRHTDAVTLDVKAFSGRIYRKLSGGRLEPVLKAIQIIREQGVWLELSTLLVTGISDDLDDIERLCAWIAGNVGPDVPLHFLRFHPDYRLRRLPPTPVETLEKARERARRAGLRFVYVGNVPGHEGENTYCPRDGRLLIERRGYLVLRNELVDGRCPCGEPIAGVWT